MGSDHPRAAVGLDRDQHVLVDPTLRRPAEVELLQGDYRKAKAELGWEPKVSFRELIEMMVKADQEHYRRAQNGVR